MDKSILAQNSMEEKTQAGQLLYLSADRLKLHPQNMRRYYPPQDVARMAESIRATGGVYQAMLVTPDDSARVPEETGYYVIDGNMRLAGGRLLGENCPPFKCEIISADHAEQLLAMAATTEFHFPKDPISQAYHYRRLIEQEKLTVQAIVERTGVSRSTIDKLLKLLELEPEIQQWLAEGKISADVRITRALLSLPDSATRLRLGHRFAKQGTSTKNILQACRFVTRQAAHLESQDAVQRLEAEQAKKQQMVAKVLQAKFAPVSRPRLDPQAARLIHAAAESTLCEDCRLSGLTEQCYLCPGPRDFINSVIELLEVDAPELQQQPPASQANGKLAGEKARLITLGRQLRRDFSESNFSESEAA